MSVGGGSMSRLNQLVEKSHQNQLEPQNVVQAEK